MTLKLTEASLSENYYKDCCHFFSATFDDELIKSTIHNLVKQVIAIEDNKKMKSETDYLTKIAAMTG